jgi:glycosyltransferase involved in cell wall biosynthesis
MKIAILLPYKENYSKLNAGAVSIFVNDTVRLSKYNKDIKVYGSTISKKVLKNYVNINFQKKFYQSSSNEYLRRFLYKIKNKKIDILEVHNRPHYINFLSNLSNCKKVLFFHNDPLNMQGSVSVKERLNLLNITDKIIFNSNWSKSRFLIDLPSWTNQDKLSIIYQSTSKTKINFTKKKNIISFIGKLNTSKGYDIFGKAIIRILNKHNNWRAIVIGDEPRQKIFFNHKNLDHLGFKENSFILNKLKEVSIATVPSRWDEPFGRSSLEAASRGCALILSNTGGLSETTNHAVILSEISDDDLFKKLDYLIKNKSFRNLLQKKTYNDFKLTNHYAAKTIDNLRSKIIINKINLIKNTKNPLKIIHITNFNERFDGRLHYNTGKRINNGLIRLGHNILTISDRDILSNYKNLKDPKGINTLNKKIITSFNNFNPDLIIAGHADNILPDTFEYLRNKNKSLKIAQWFLDPLSKFGPDFIKNKKRLLKNINFVDANFLTTDPNSIEFKIKNSYFIPNPADKSFETLENYKQDCENDMFFAMSHGVHRGILKKNKSDNREKILEKLLLKNGEIKFDFYGLNNRQPLWAEDFKNQLSKSKMGLNLSRGKPLKYYSSDRIAQLMGNGLLTFIDEKTSYSDFFNKKEIVTYKNLQDLIEKILKFKKNDKQRRLIAKNGKNKYLKIFNSTNVASYIISKTFDIKNKSFW